MLMNYRFISQFFVLLALFALFGVSSVGATTGVCYQGINDASPKCYQTPNACITAGGTATGCVSRQLNPNETLITIAPTTDGSVVTDIYGNTLAPAGGGGQGTGYRLLAPIPAIGKTTGVTLVEYMKGVFVATIGLAIVLAVIELVIGGIEYVAAAVPSAKEDAKKRIGGAVGGLLLILLAWVLLQALNPKLLNVGLNLEKVAVVGQPSIGSTAGDTNNPGSGAVGSCSVMDNGPCAVSNLAGFCGDATKANNASMICNAESRGDATRASTVDCIGGGPIGNGKYKSCAGKDAFSFGLFQINITQHSVGGLNCPSAFSGKNFTATIVNRPLYDQCVSEAKNPGSNIREMLRTSRGCSNWGQWSTHTQCNL